MRLLAAAIVAAVIAAAGTLCRADAPFDAGAPLVYSADAADPWNRIFALLFTRTIAASETDEFPGAGPFRRPADSLPRLRVSTRTFDWFEDGDRAIEALYPSFLTADGLDYILNDSRRPALLRALGDALAERAARPPLDRALMQGDLWSAFDALDKAATSRYGPRARRIAAVSLTAPLARLIGKIALDDRSIASLPDNYAAARRRLPLPDVFAPGGEWMEVVMSTHRMHDQSAGMRRVSRVFVRRRASAPGTQAFLTDLRFNRTSGIVQAVLLMQMLLVDGNGRVMPSPLISDVQIRTPAHESGVTVEEFELSRRQLRGDLNGGFRRFANGDPAYLPIGGNDYGFATPHFDRSGQTAPVVGTLESRCASCHGPDGSGFMTFGLVSAPGVPLPPVKELRQPNDERARDVAKAKEARAEFQRLVALAFNIRRR